MSQKENKMVNFKGKSPIKKKIKAKAFEKKIIKKIYIDKDRDFIVSLYTKNDEGIYLLNRETFAKDEVKRIKSIAKDVKKNSGGIFDVTKLGLVLGIVIVIALFSVLFKNMLLTKALETGLESVFAAKSDVEGLDFKLLKAQVHISHLEVADADSPMNNLFELGQTKIDLNFTQLLYGKAVVENIQCLDIKWNTARETSGELVKKEKDTEEDKKKQAAEEQKKPLFSTGDIDVNKIIEDNKDAIKSKAVISEANAEIKNLNGKWDNNLKESGKKIDEAKKGVEDIKRINVSGIKTPEQGEKALKDINNYIATVDSLKKEADKLNADFKNDKKKTEELKNNIVKAKDEDLKYFKSLIKLPSGGAKGMLSSIANDFLSKKLGKMYFYAMKGLEYSKSLKSGKAGDKQEEQKEKKENTSRRQGRQVFFPTDRYPAFLIKNMEASVDQKKDNFYAKSYIKDITSDPDMWDKPVSFYYDQKQSGREVLADGNLDIRSKAASLMKINLSLNNYPLEIKESPGFLNVSDISGTYRFSTGFSIDKNKATKGTAKVSLNNVKMKLTGQDMVSKAVYDVVTNTPEILLDVSFSVGADGAVSVSGKSNLDKALSDRVGKIIDQKAKDYEAKIKDNLSGRLNDELKENELLAKTLGGKENILGSDVKDIDALKKSLEDKKKEINDKVKKETESKAKDAIKDKTKGIKAPKF